MDLALAQGKSLFQLSKLTEREFCRWAVYAGKYLMPQRRLELGLAQIALMIARTMGGDRDSTLQDFLFDPPPDHPKPEDQLSAAIIAFDFKPRNRKPE